MNKIGLHDLHSDVHVTFLRFKVFSSCGVNFIVKVAFSHFITCHSNALANATRRLIEKLHEFATVYPTIYCRKSNVIT